MLSTHIIKTYPTRKCLPINKKATEVAFKQNTLYIYIWIIIKISEETTDYTSPDLHCIYFNYLFMYLSVCLFLSVVPPFLEQTIQLKKLFIFDIFRVPSTNPACRKLSQSLRILVSNRCPSATADMILNQSQRIPSS